jgi:hypothetical protein
LTSFNKESTPKTNRIKYKNIEKKKIPPIEEANLYLLKRINGCSPYYSVNKWEKDYEKSQYYKKNHCQLPIIDFKKYKKQNKPNKLNMLFRNYSEINKNINSALLSNNNSFYNSFNDNDDINNNDNYISLHFFLNDKSVGEHSYIIISSLNVLFSEVTQKLFKTASFLKKDKIIGFTLQDNDKISLLELNKTVQDNGLKDGSKIFIQFK